MSKCDCVKCHAARGLTITKIYDADDKLLGEMSSVYQDGLFLCVVLYPDRKVGEGEFEADSFVQAKEHASFMFRVKRLINNLTSENWVPTI